MIARRNYLGNLGAKSLHLGLYWLSVNALATPTNDAHLHLGFGSLHVPDLLLEAQCLTNGLCTLLVE